MTDDPVRRALENAPLDDEPETEEERVRVEQAKREFETGDTVSMDEVKRMFGLEMPPRKFVIEITGCVETNLSHDEWIDLFVEWLESRGEYFGGGSKDVTNDE